MSKVVVFDTETDGLLDEITKFHIFGWTLDGKEYHTTQDFTQFKQVLESSDYAVCHNSIRFDFEAMKKVFGYEYKGIKIDSLALSWIFNPQRPKHGLEAIGVEHGIKKVEVEDHEWKDGNYELMKERVTEDVKINWKEWKKQASILEQLYKTRSNVDKYLKYLQFKIECASYQERNPVRLDYQKVTGHIEELEKQQEVKVEELKEVMPKRALFKKFTPPKKPYKKDGTLSASGITWLKRLDLAGKPKTYKGEIKLLDGYEEPNPNSTDQIKNWLFDLGWEPCTFKYVEDRKIPQVRFSDPGHPRKGELTDSVEVLIEKEPSIEVLKGLTVIQHRLGVFKAFRDNSFVSQGERYVKAEVHGFTNTLRFKHKVPLVNLPGVDKDWGKEIRGCLVANKGCTMLGADMVSLESTTKRHYIKPFDPEYVEEMSKEGYDEHLDLAVYNGVISREDYEWYIRQDEDKTNQPEKYKTLKKLRKEYKPVNYSAVYGVGPPKLSRTTGMSLSKAKEMLEAYWERNWAVREVVKTFKTRQAGGLNWVQNPVSGFWHELRFEKDKFSTVNQSTGVYLFDRFLQEASYLGYNGSMQFHDETANGGITNQSQTSEQLVTAVANLNKKTTLNVIVGIDYTYGKNYAEVH